jgi:hypothetical protein
MRKQALFPQIKRSERQAKRLLLSHVEIKNEWNYTPTLCILSCCAQGKLYLSFFIKTLRSRCQADTTETAGLHYVKYERYIPNVPYHIALCPPFPFVLSAWPFLRQSLRCTTRNAICTLRCFVAWRPCN